MKVNTIEARKVKKLSLFGFRKAILLIILTIVLLTIILVYLRESSLSSLRSPDLGINLIGSIPVYQINNLSSVNKCNIFKGNWVPYSKGPNYTNSTKCSIDDRQNCMKFGRPDTGFLKWRWKPDECELPLFDAARFLELVRGKSMAFVGDSVGRNQLESLMCLLASVASPVDEPSVGGAMRNWLYSDYNFTLALIWSVSLVKFSDRNNVNGSTPMGLLNLYLDEVDEAWAAQIENFDYVIISAGQWFSRPLVYHEKGKVVGCHVCKNKNIVDLTRYYGYRMAIRTAFRAILSLPNFKGETFLRTFSPTHFGSDNWMRGNCLTTRPLTKQEMKFEQHVLEFYLTQVDEFRAAEREGMRRGLKFRLLDITEAMVMRPDGHPYHYGHPPHAKQPIADCLHWCLPGPVDSWNEFLLHMLKMEGKESMDTKI